MRLPRFDGEISQGHAKRGLRWASRLGAVVVVTAGSLALFFKDPWMLIPGVVAVGWIVAIPFLEKRAEMNQQGEHETPAPVSRALGFILTLLVVLLAVVWVWLIWVVGK